MLLKKIVFVIVAVFNCTISYSLNLFKTQIINEISIIPQVKTMTLGKSDFCFNENTKLVVENATQKMVAQQLADLFKKVSGWNFAIIQGAKPAPNQLCFITDTTLNSEAYFIQVTKFSIKIKASKPAGFFYALQTLRQLLPLQIESNQILGHVDWVVPEINISDKPAFKWRGFMLDVSRHFFPKEDIFRLIDNLAFHKINVLQLHLVDQQGWRIEIKKYPKLTEVGAWRVDRGNTSWNSTFKQLPGDKTTYGGFYTQDDIREIVAYAQAHFITVVPEIEMPAHVTSALAAYPQYSCSGRPFTVLPGGYWPITDLYCAGNDSTFLFLQDVLSEVMDLFPSKYIHVGGDEANKSEWEKCPKCQKRMQDEHLKNAEELQGYFIKRIENFIHSKGRILIGWDEILQGGLPADATIMSWRGEKGSIQAVKSGHDVVMTPGAYCYFDSYQAPMANEPTAMGGYLPMKKVYSFNPVPNELDSMQAKHILGAQANLWTEYISDLQYAEYMIFPRIAALSEVLWSKSENRNWDDFSMRMQKLMKRYDLMKINYSKCAFQPYIFPDYDTIKNKLKIKIEREFPVKKIYYTLNNTNPTKNAPVYKNPLYLNKSTVVKATCFENNIPKIITDSFDINLATGKPVEYITLYNDGFKGKGKLTLTNGIRGSIHYNDEEWQGWNATNAEVVVDLQTTNEINTISVGFLQDIGTWMFMPLKVEFYVSTNKKDFMKVGEVSNDVDPLSYKKQIKDFILDFRANSVKFIKIIARNSGLIPVGHPLAGDNSWVFFDEIKVK